MFFFGLLVYLFRPCDGGQSEVKPITLLALVPSEPHQVLGFTVGKSSWTYRYKQRRDARSAIVAERPALLTCAGYINLDIVGDGLTVDAGCRVYKHGVVRSVERH
jgi:hypothetical protein